MSNYVKTVWTDDAGEKVDAVNLNKIELGIENAADTTSANTFTGPQRIEIDSAGDNSIDFDIKNNISFTATAADITVTAQTIGQGGTIVIDSADLITGWGTEFDFGFQGAPIGLTGTETFGYFIFAASGAASIKIGRV